MDWVVGTGTAQQTSTEKLPAFFTKFKEEYGY